MNKLKINTWTGVFDIVDCVILVISWFAIFAAAFNGGADSSASFFYVVQWIGVILHIIALYKSKQAGISIVGPVLGLIGCALSGLMLAISISKYRAIDHCNGVLILTTPIKEWR